MLAPPPSRRSDRDPLSGWQLIAFFGVLAALVVSCTWAGVLVYLTGKS